MKNELTDEQVEEITERHVRQVGDHWCHESAIVEADALEFARAVIAAHEALQAGQEPALAQYRMAANWNEPRRWTGWDDCSPEAAADYERIKVLHDWEYQVRRLYAAPQPAPDKDAEMAALRKPLTEAQIALAWVSTPDPMALQFKDKAHALAFVRAIEALKQAIAKVVQPTAEQSPVWCEDCGWSGTDCAGPADGDSECPQCGASPVFFRPVAQAVQPTTKENHD